MNEEILKLAKECGFVQFFSNGVFDDRIEAFYRATYNKAIEDAAVCAWSYYADVCKTKGMNPHHFSEWIPSKAIRKLEKTK